MRDYRTYTKLYTQVGFFVLLIAVFTITFKAAAWVIWAEQCINAAL